MEKRPTLKEIPLEQLQEDPHHPRDLDEIDDELGQLLESIEKLAIMEPLIASEDKENLYTILDGHRRYRCAKRLNLKIIPCHVYPKLSRGEFLHRQFEKQTNHLDWKPLERAEAFAQMKQIYKIEKDKDLAKFVKLSTSVVSSSLNLLKLHSHHKDLMDKYKLKQSYRMEFLRIMGDIRKIRDLEKKQIFRILFEKIEYGVIKNAKNLRSLRSFFLRADRYEEQLYEFLKDRDMTFKELEQLIERSPMVNVLERAAAAVAKKLNSPDSLTAEEHIACQQLLRLLTQLVQVSRPLREQLVSIQ